MPQLTLLTPSFPLLNPNLEVLQPALARAGIAYELLAFDTLRLNEQTVEAMDADGRYACLREAALLWPFGFGTRVNILDKLQLLQLAARAGNCVTTPAALLFAHAKYELVTTRPPLAHPETYASHDANWLWQKVCTGGDWIVKPPAASFGRGVFRINAADRNAHALLLQLTDHGHAAYAVLQRYVPEIEAGEKRVLLAFGRVIGAYSRLPNAAGLTNLSVGGNAVACTLSVAEQAACAALALQLQAAGVGYAGIDLAFPWLIEVNVANPGGLATLVALGDTTAPDRLAAALTRRLATRSTAAS